AAQFLNWVFIFGSQLVYILGMMVFADHAEYMFASMAVCALLPALWMKRALAMPDDAFAEARIAESLRAEEESAPA
ncbi:MAG: hypothetical protein AB7S36_23125, partial [Planctomycetota bacterium]